MANCGVCTIVPIKASLQREARPHPSSPFSPVSLVNSLPRLLLCPPRLPLPPPASSAATQKFGVSGAAVARVWADKILEWVVMGDDSGIRRFSVTVLDPFPSLGISPLAAILQAICVFILLRGVTVGKRITTVLTALKVGGDFDRNYY